MELENAMLQFGLKETMYARFQLLISKRNKVAHSFSNTNTVVGSLVPK